jgi:hypothetical protein
LIPGTGLHGIVPGKGKPRRRFKVQKAAIDARKWMDRPGVVFSNIKAIFRG